MSILATTPPAVPSLPIGLMPIAASPVAPVDGGAPFGFCDVLPGLDVPLPAAEPVLPVLPVTGTSLPTPAGDAPEDIDVADVMIGAQPMPEPGFQLQPGVRQPPVLPKPILSSMPQPAGDEPVPTGLIEAGPDIQPIAVEPLLPKIRPWVLATSSSLTVARALPTLPKGERASLPDKAPKPADDAPAAIPAPVMAIQPAPETAPPPPLPPPAFTPVAWTSPPQAKDTPSDAAPNGAAPVVLFPISARPIAQVPPGDPPPPAPSPALGVHTREALATPLAAPIVVESDAPARSPVSTVAGPEAPAFVSAPVPGSAETAPLTVSSREAPVRPPMPVAAPEAPAPLPKPVAASPIAAAPVDLPPELTRHIAQMLPPHMRAPIDPVAPAPAGPDILPHDLPAVPAIPRAETPAEPAALTPAEPTVFPVSAPAPQVAATPHPVATSQPPPIDTARGAWMDAMIERIAEMPQVDGRREAVIRLLPDQLGAIEVTVTERDDRLHVFMNADSAQARQMLSDAAPRLHELAEARGLRFAQADVGGGQSHDRRPASDHPAQPARPRPARAADNQETPDGDLIA